MLSTIVCLSLSGSKSNQSTKSILFVNREAIFFYRMTEKISIILTMYIYVSAENTFGLIT